MSKLTEFIERPCSYVTDLSVSTVVGMSVGFIMQHFVLEDLPYGLGDNLAYAIGGVVGATLFVRARRNLSGPPPKYTQQTTDQ